MHRTAKWAVIAVGGLLALALLAVATVYVGSEMVLRRTYDVPLVAPNLTRMAARHSDAELGRMIRDGVRPDGRSTWGMPSATFYHLSDVDLGAILAVIRSQPVTQGPSTEVEVRLLARLGVLTGEFPPQAQIIDHEAPRLGEEPRSDTLAFGERRASTGPAL